MAFKFAYKIGGGAPFLKSIVIADTVVLVKGMIVNLETGELTIGVTADVALAGVTNEAKDNTDDGEICEIIMDPDAVYSVVDANARLIGATLDIETGGLLVASTSNADLIVVETSTATEPTLVTFAGSHYLQL